MTSAALAQASPPNKCWIRPLGGVASGDVATGCRDIVPPAADWSRVWMERFAACGFGGSFSYSPGKSRA